MAARLKERYEAEIVPQLVDKFGYSSVMQTPRIEKVTLNMGLGEGKGDSNSLEKAREQLAQIAGQAPNVRRARQSIAGFKLREGMIVGLSVTLRGQRGFEFLDRLISVAIPRVRDFRGLTAKSFDGHGNFSMGIREQVIFPEIDYDSIDRVRGLDVTITTSAQTDAEGFALLTALGMPFAKDRKRELLERAANGDVVSDEEAETSDEPEVSEKPETSGQADAAVEAEASDEAPEAEAASEEAATDGAEEATGATE